MELGNPYCGTFRNNRREGGRPGKGFFPASAPRNARLAFGSFLLHKHVGRGRRGLGRRGPGQGGGQRGIRAVHRRPAGEIDDRAARHALGVHVEAPRRRRAGRSEGIKARQVGVRRPAGLIRHRRASDPGPVGVRRDGVPRKGFRVRGKRPYCRSGEER